MTEESPELADVLDTLESMVTQHFFARPDGTFDDECLSANEEAAETLVQYRPQRWALTKRGLRLKESGEP